MKQRWDGVIVWNGAKYISAPLPVDRNTPKNDNAYVWNHGNILAWDGEKYVVSGTRDIQTKRTD